MKKYAVKRQMQVVLYRENQKTMEYEDDIKAIEHFRTESQ